MDKCRICLKEFRLKRLISLFTSENNVRYCEKLCAISSVKIAEEEKLPNMICLSCTNKVKEAYELKLLAESSDLALRHGKSKRINFSNINEIRLEIETVKIEKDIEDTKAGLDLDFNNKENVFYNDIIIKKVLKNEEDEYKKNTLSVKEFLQNFKEEDNNNCGVFDDDIGAFDDFQVYGSDDSNDLDDIPIGTLRKFSKKKKKKNKKSKKKEEYYDDDYNDYDPKNDKKYSDEEYIPGNKCKKKKDPVKKASRVGRPLKSPRPELIPILIKPVLMPDIKVYPMFSKKRIPKPRKKKPFSALCPFCGILNPAKSHILLHTEEKKFKCDQCPKSFFSEKLLKNHKLVHGERTFHCTQCTATFHKSTSLKRHGLTHSNEKKFVCSICNKGFKRKSALLRHVLGHNLANKSVKCDLCNMSFFCRVGLRHHMRVHTGERPYNCELCSQPYSYKHDFNRHCIKKHGVFLKRRQVHVMNAEVLVRERKMMQELALKAHGIVREGEKLNPFEGPQADLAFTQAITAIKNRQIPVELPMIDESLPLL